MASIGPSIRQRFFDSNGIPLNGGKLYSYAAGTNTPKATYSDKANTPNTNPIILDSAGYCDLWLGIGYYKFVLKDSSDVTLWTKDQVSGALDVTDLFLEGANGNRALVTNSDGKIIESAISAEELGRLIGVTSPVQDQIDSKVTNPMTTDYDMIYSLTGAPKRLPATTGVLQKGGGAPAFTQSPALASPTVSTLLNLTGGQIQFPATQIPSANVNTLDDYKEGTWIPVVTGFTVGNGSVTGTYTKIGRIVTCSMTLTFGSTSSFATVTGINGLPFTVGAGSVANFIIQDTGTTWFRGFSIVPAGLTTTSYVMVNTNSTIDATSPMAWANGDIMNMSLTYSV